MSVGLLGLLRLQALSGISANGIQNIWLREFPDFKVPQRLVRNAYLSLLSTPIDVAYVNWGYSVVEHHAKFRLVEDGAAAEKEGFYVI